MFQPAVCVAASAFPEAFPCALREEERPTIGIPHRRLTDEVPIFTGRVEVLDEDEGGVLARVYSSPTMTFVARGNTLSEARTRLARRMREAVPAGFSYRNDIGRF